MNNASGGDGAPVELFQILKHDAVKVLHSICRKDGKLSSGHRIGKSQFSFQFQRRYPNGQQVRGKGLNITHHQGDSNQNHNEVSPHTC